jgi:hypothetical protein
VRKKVRKETTVNEKNRITVKLEIINKNGTISMKILEE